MRSLVYLCLSLSLVVACKGKKKSEEAPADEDKIAECESNADCEAGYVCLAGACASTKSEDIYADPKNAVTPDKVRQHLEQINDEAHKEAEKALDM